MNSHSEGWDLPKGREILMCSPFISSDCLFWITEALVRAGGEGGRRMEKAFKISQVLTKASGSSVEHRCGLGGHFSSL